MVCTVARYSKINTGNDVPQTGKANAQWSICIMSVVACIEHASGLRHAIAHFIWSIKLTFLLFTFAKCRFPRKWIRPVWPYSIQHSPSCRRNWWSVWRIIKKWCREGELSLQIHLWVLHANTVGYIGRDIHGIGHINVYRTLVWRVKTTDMSLHHGSGADIRWCGAQCVGELIQYIYRPISNCHWHSNSRIDQMCIWVVLMRNKIRSDGARSERVPIQ